MKRTRLVTAVPPPEYAKVTGVSKRDTPIELLTLLLWLLTHLQYISHSTDRKNFLLLAGIGRRGAGFMLRVFEEIGPRPELLRFLSLCFY